MNPKVIHSLNSKPDAPSGPPSFAPIPVEGREYCDICEEMKSSVSKCSHEEESPIVKNRNKLLILGLIAALALFSICVIGEELISRRLQRSLIVKDHFERRELYELSRHHPKPLSLPSPTEDGLYWSSFIQAAVSPGLNDIETDIIMKKLREKRVEMALRPDWLHCGRDKNRYVIFEDGSEACSRNREAPFIQGEVMAFYLARFLGIRNTPAVVLSKLTSDQWKSVDVKEAVVNGTAEITALIQWIPNLVKDTMPSVIRKRILPYLSPESSPVLPPISGKSVELSEMSNEELSTLIQWGDMIIFDYLTGNYDRLASMQDAAMKYGDPSVLGETINNLVRSTDTSSLWLIDNESAFLKGYSLMYSSEEETGKRFLNFHAKALGSLCVFRRRTIERLQFLESTEDPAELLLGFIHKREPLFKDLSSNIHLDTLLADKLKERVLEVMEWFKYCQDRA